MVQMDIFKAIIFREIKSTGVHSSKREHRGVTMTAHSSRLMAKINTREHTFR